MQIITILIHGDTTPVHHRSTNNNNPLVRVRVRQRLSLNQNETSAYNVVTCLHLCLSPNSTTYYLMHKVM
jgi:hypothetical protein